MSDKTMWSIMRYALAGEGVNRLGGIGILIITPLMFKLDGELGSVALACGMFLVAFSTIQAITRYLFLDMFGEETHNDDEGL